MNVVIEPKFDSAEPFSEGVGVVEVGHMDRYISKDGKFIFDEEFERATSFSGGAAIIYQEGFSYVINHNGEKLCKLEDDIYIQGFVDGISFFCKDDKYRYIDIDTKGNVSKLIYQLIISIL